jgi:Ca2+/Na+ antiporter
VKKVNDTGVFAITTVWSIIAYIWLYVVLSDGFVDDWEAFLTLGFFFILIIMAYTADCLRRKKEEKREAEEALEKANQKATNDDVSAFKGTFNKARRFEVIDFYNKLLPLEAGNELKP